MDGFDDEAHQLTLKHMVVDTLEQQGVLSNIRASLRAAVFLAVNEQQAATVGPGERLTAVLDAPQGPEALASCRDSS